MTPEKQFLIDTEKRAREAGVRVRWWYRDYLVLGLPEDQTSLKPPPNFLGKEENDLDRGTAGGDKPTQTY